MSGVNSRDYWDSRFSSGDWDDKFGREQSRFFYNIFLANIPEWFEEDVNQNALSLCDLGCAQGDGLDILAQRFKNSDLTGVDFSQSAVNTAKLCYPSCNFEQCDINSLTGHYDIIFSSNTLEHFVNPDKILANILPHCGKYLVLLLPFREFDLIEEHMYTFDYPFFCIAKNNFCCVYSKEIDCSNAACSQWDGMEILVIYMNMHHPDFTKMNIGHLNVSNFKQLLNQRKLHAVKDEKIRFLENTTRSLKETVKNRENQIEMLTESAEENRNAIMQIQFEAKQYKEAMLDARETYTWKTGARIENILMRTGIAFIRSVLEVSDFHRCGFWLTIRKAMNEIFNCKKINPRRRLYKKMCAEKFLNYKKIRDKNLNLNIKTVSCVCKKGLVSIVMPALNGETVISQAIESVLAQTYSNFELIIINDGSTDRTKEIIEEYAKKDSRIKIVNQDNKKIPRTLSRGFKSACGEFFTWISVDNIMTKDCIEKLLDSLNKNPDIAMVYGNMRLIDAKGKPKRGHLWFEKPFGSGNVCMPVSADTLNTFPNNTIGAAFMYRSIVGRILEDYSTYKYMLEDYDYWMRMNSLFKIKHIEHKDPIYLYRWHKNSLTAHDKELGITRNRYKLMILDDFRRDFYCSHLIWVIDTESEDNINYKDFLEKVGNNGHILISSFDIENLSVPQVASGTCYIYFGENPNYRSKAMEKCEYKIIVSDTGNVSSEGFDVCISNKPVDTQDICSYKGWFCIEDSKEIFSFLDVKIKNKLLYKIEGLVENEIDSEKKVSIIICTYMREAKLIDAIWSVLRQSFSKKEYEILIVDNAPFGSNLEDKIDEFKEKYIEYDGFIRYIAVAQKGLSYARNAGVWNAKGKYLLFLDDDILADYYLIEEIYSAFKYHPDAGVVGGQIILDIPFPRPVAVRNGWESLWSQFKITNVNYKEVTQRFEFPYGANYAVSRQAIWRIGGFRMSYGRIGKDFSGGEETALVLKMRQLGYEIGLQPRAKVLHCVDHDRFNMEHVKNTIRSIVFTTHKFYKDLYSNVGWTRRYVKNQIEITKKEIKRFKHRQEDERDIYYKKCMLSAWREILQHINN